MALLQCPARLLTELDVWCQCLPDRGVLKGTNMAIAMVRMGIGENKWSGTWMIHASAQSDLESYLTCLVLSSPSLLSV